MSQRMKWLGRLGVPYQGSKNQIALEIISILPSGRRFVDLFAGGCAMTHAAILSGKYETFVANDIHGFGVRLFRDAIAGKCNGAWRHWVSREEFFAKRDTDPLISLCWSFSNNGRDYLYAKHLEARKRELHLAYVNGRITKQETLLVDGHVTYSSFARPESLERLRALERLQALERDYREVKIAAGDVVYADPPYANTQRYNAGAFDNDEFWDWARCQAHLGRCVFVSEYTAPADFRAIWCKGKCQLMHALGATGKKQERIFVYSDFADQYQTDLFL